MFMENVVPQGLFLSLPRTSAEQCHSRAVPQDLEMRHSGFFWYLNEEIVTSCFRSRCVCACVCVYTHMCPCAYV